MLVNNVCRVIMIMIITIISVHGLLVSRHMLGGPNHGKQITSTLMDGQCVLRGHYRYLLYYERGLNRHCERWAVEWIRTLLSVSLARVFLPLNFQFYTCKSTGEKSQLINVLNLDNLYFFFVLFYFMALCFICFILKLLLLALVLF